MPMLDAYIPAGALTPEAGRRLLGTRTDLLIEHDGADPNNEKFRSLAWVFVHRHEMYVAGAPAEARHYRFVCLVPEGQYDENRRAAVTKAMTKALVEAEGGKWPNPDARVWVFTFEVAAGSWGGLGDAWSPCRTSMRTSSATPVAVTANSASPSCVGSRRVCCSRLLSPRQATLVRRARSIAA
jgi:phenylpyruvate tautomerase PptA (4-oxalocrotonate tautomerase family)